MGGKRKDDEGRKSQARDNKCDAMHKLVGWETNLQGCVCGLVRSWEMLLASRALEKAGGRHETDARRV